MAQGGVLGYVKVAYSLSSPISWVEVDQIVDVVFPTYEGDQVDITTYHPTNKLKKNMPGYVQVGDPEIEVLSDDDPTTSPDQAALLDANVTGVSLWWRFEKAVNRERTSFRGVEFQAGVKSVAFSTPMMDRATTRYTLTFDGTAAPAWDLTVGASEF